MTLPWIPEKDAVAPGERTHADAVHRGLERLKALDVPALWLEAVVIYRPERLAQDAEVGRTIDALIESNQLSNDTVQRWTKMRNWRSPERTLLENALRRIENRQARRGLLVPPNRVCCPIVFSAKSWLLPNYVISGVRWIEVIGKGPGDSISSGFSTKWEKRFERIGEAVRSLFPVPAGSTAPRWKLLDSLGQRDSSLVDDDHEDTASLELGAALAYALWLGSLSPSGATAATGTLSEDCRGVLDVDHVTGKFEAVRREAPNVRFLVAPAGVDQRVAVAKHGSGIPVLHCDELGTALTWLRELSNDAPRQTHAANRTSSRRLFLPALAAGLALMGGGFAYRVHRLRPARALARTRDSGVDVPATAIAVDARPLTDHLDATAFADQTLAHPSPSDASNDADASDSDLGDCQDAPVPCAYLAANGVCRIRMESPLFYGAWPPGLAGNIRWFLPQGSERPRFELSDQGCSDGQPTAVTITADAGIAHIVIPVPTRHPSRRQCPFGRLLACLQATERGTDIFCSSVKTITGPIGRRARVTSIGSDGRRVDFPAQACGPTDDVAALEMGLELSGRSSQLLADGQRGYRLTARWSVRGVPMPARLMSMLADRTHGPAIEGLPESGEAVLDLPMRDGGTDVWPILVCIQDATTLTVRCKSVS